MNAGFSNLAFLKSRLLLAADAEGTSYDDAVAALGLGVVGLFEALTDRKFERVENDIWEASATRRFSVVPRYPIEEVSKVELRTDMQSGFIEQVGLPQNFNPQAGIVYFGFAPGYDGCTVRVTYTGGFWWDTEEDNSGTMPDGATLIPQGLVQAWVLACKFLWDRQSIEDRAKAGFSDKELERFITSDTKLPDLVTQTIEKFRRFA
jgi:hypothetical protein